MKIIQSLVDWDYPVLNNPLSFRTNIHMIVDYLYRDGGNYQFVGMGTSGAAILGGLAMEVSNKTILLRESYNGKPKPIFDNLPIIIVDDHILTGTRLKKIKQYLLFSNVSYLIEGIVMNEFKGCKDDSEDCRAIQARNEHDIKSLFPQAKFWLR